MSTRRRARRISGASLSALAIGLLAGDGVAQTTTYTYDALGRLIGSSVQGGATSNYNYDPAGNRSSVTVTNSSSPTPSPTPGPTPTPTPTPPPAAIGQVANAHFTQPAVSGGNFQYGPIGTSDWYFSDSAGVQSDGSAWGFPAVVDGDGRSAFLQSSSAFIVLNVTNLTVGATYVVKFKLALRPGYSINPVYVAALNNNVGVYSTPYGGWEQMTTSSFVANSSSGTVYFAGTTGDGYYASGIDDVHVEPAGQ